MRIRPIDNDLDEYGVNQSKYTTNTYLINSNSLVPGHRYNVTVRKYNLSGTQIGISEIEFTVGGANSIMLEKELEIRPIVHDGVYAYDDLNVS